VNCPGTEHAGALTRGLPIAELVANGEVAINVTRTPKKIFFMALLLLVASFGRRYPSTSPSPPPDL
jgi:hypothetical protein